MNGPYDTPGRINKVVSSLSPLLTFPQAEVKSALALKSYLLNKANAADEERLNARCFYFLWECGALKGYQNQALVVDKGKPVLTVQLAKGCDDAVWFRLGKNYKHPVLFLPCKMARWPTSPNLEYTGDQEVFNEVCERLDADETTNHVEVKFDVIRALSSEIVDPSEMLTVSFLSLQI